jgi:hypothetical protein
MKFDKARVHLHELTVEKDYIYNLILGFQYCQVSQVHSITL